MNEQQFKVEVIPLNKRLLQTALRFNYDLNWAKDIVQDVYLTLWSRRKKLNDIRSIEAYAIQITHNACIDKLKKMQLVNIDNINYSVSDESQNIDKQTEQAEMVSKIRSLIKQLPYMQQMAITLCDLEQLSISQAAEKLVIKEGTLRTNLSRARKKIADQVKKWSNLTTVHSAETNIVHQVN